MEAEAGMTDEEMGDSRRIKEKEAVIVGRIEGAKWALERAVQVKSDLNFPANDKSSVKLSRIGFNQSRKSRRSQRSLKIV